MEIAMRNGRAASGATGGMSGVGKVAAGAAIGFVAGLAATQAKKAAVQGVSVAAGDWCDALIAEHRMVQKLFQTLQETTEAQSKKRQMLLAKIAYALTKHAIEEENVVYPALSHSTQHGQAAHLAEEHARIKTFIYDLRQMEASDPRWLTQAKAFQDFVEEHIREEEEEIFPRFRESLSADENHRLTTMMNWEGYKVA